MFLEFQKDVPSQQEIYETKKFCGTGPKNVPEIEVRKNEEGQEVGVRQGLLHCVKGVVFHSQAARKCDGRDGQKWRGL